jgi:hypothetical protein
MKKLIPLAGVVGFVAFGDTLAALALAVLALIWVMLPADEGPPVLALAVTMQWVAVCVGYFYVLITGRPLEATIRADYHTMVLLGLGCVVATAFGVALGRMLIERLRPPQGLRPAHALSFKTLILVYVVFTTSLSVTQITNIDFGGLQMAVVALTYLRLGLVYLVFRRLILLHDWHYLAAMLAIEVVLGITGFYAGFREPLIMAALAFLEFFDRRSVRQWATLGVLGGVMVTLGVMWIGVRVEYRGRWMDDERFSNSRSARVDLLRESVNAWASQGSHDMLDNIDRFVERMWTIYYPALAVERVPSAVPHTGGALMADTLRYVFEPRLFFPDKPYIASDSEMVRKYAGVAVAGEDQNTDIAFGYAAESYVDYGVPGMFVPAFVWGLFIGVAISLIFREYHHRDMAISVATVIGWMSLYLFERSWAKTIGMGGTLLIYAGGLCYVLDRLWFEKFKKLYDGNLDEEGEVLDAEPESPQLQLHPQPQSK